MDRENERQPPSHEEQLRERTETLPHPDYPRPYDPVDEQRRDAQTATARRLEREETAVRSGLVAGHDFKREHAERERSR